MSTNKTRAFAFRAALVLLMAAAIACLVACSPVGRFPNTATVGRISVDYPDELAQYREPHVSMSGSEDARITERSVYVGNDDYSFGFLLQDSDGISFNEAWRIAEHIREARLAVADELEEKWGIPKRIAENTFYDGPTRVEVDGVDAFVLESRYVYPDRSVPVDIVYVIRIGDDGVGLLGGSFSNGEYEADRELYDRIFASVRIEE